MEPQPGQYWIRRRSESGKKEKVLDVIRTAGGAVLVWVAGRYKMSLDEFHYEYAFDGPTLLLPPKTDQT